MRRARGRRCRLPVENHRPEFQSLWLDGPFRDWLEAVPAEHVVGIAGNHDFVFARPAGAVPDGLRWTYLQDCEAEVAGLRVFGTPWTRTLGGWAFEGDETPDLEAIFGLIPAGLDLLVTHSPPFGLGDRVLRFDPVGSTSLLRAVEEKMPRLTVYGHVHEDRGRWTLGESQLANVSVLDERYRRLHAPMAFEL